MDDYRYTYAVARISVLTTKLLDHDFASKMLTVEPDEIVRMLRETVYAESLAEMENPSQIERSLLRELRKTHELLERICPEPELMRLFRIRYDFDNLKAILESSITDIPYHNSVTELGSYDTDKLSATLNEKRYRFIPEHLKDAALEAMAEYEMLGKLDAIACSCDRSAWCYIMQEVRKHRNKIITALFREYINLANIKTFLRITEMMLDSGMVKRFFIPGGDYTEDFFIHHSGDQLGLFLEHLATTRYERDIVSHGLETWPEDKSFWRLEIACDNFILRRFWKMRLQLFSIAPLIYYLLRKTAEIKLIRAIIKCKLVGMSRSQIETHLRYIYV